MEKLNLKTLRRVALVGLAIVLLVDFVSSLRLHGGTGLGVVILIVMTLAASLAAIVFMPRATGTLLGNKDLLVPFGLAVVAGKLLGWLGALPVLGTLLKPALPIHFFSIGLSLSVSFVLYIALAAAYASWVTAALLELVRTGNSDPCLVMTTAGRRFWRVLGLEFIGWATVMVVTALLLLLMPVIQFFALVPLAVFGVAWNFATSALLPVAFATESSFGHSFRAGVAASLGGLRKWWPLLIAQMLLLGLVFYYQSHSGTNTSVSWSINVFWTGGYEDECRWYGKLVEAAHSTELPLVETLLMLLFGTFAIAVKLAIVQRLQPEATAAESPAAPTDLSPEQACARP